MAKKLVTGAQGAQGYVGVGITGPTGPQGSTAVLVTGPQGFSGAMGVIGPQGMQGSALPIPEGCVWIYDKEEITEAKCRSQDEIRQLSESSFCERLVLWAERFHSRYLGGVSDTTARSLEDLE
jgi:nicotinamide mononucleotide (NMN) deamidase PncC